MIIMKVCTHANPSLKDNNNNYNNYNNDNNESLSYHGISVTLSFLIKVLIPPMMMMMMNDNNNNYYYY